ncbi:MAG: type IV pilus secretin PilQ [Betaproteobacteria bacterium]
MSTAHPRGARWIAAALLVVVPALGGAQAPVAPAANAVERVEATQTSAGVVLTVQLRKPMPAAPASFSVANPARIVVDLPGIANEVGRTAVELNRGDLRSVNIVESEGRSRLVLNLRQPVPFSIEPRGNQLLVALGGVATAGAFGSAAGAAAAPAPGPRSLRGVDFRRGVNNEGRVVLDLSDPATTVNIRQQGGQVVVELLDTQLPAGLQRRFDVTDFGTPVAMVVAQQTGANARLTIDARGLWEHNAYQTDERLIVEFKPVKEDPTKLFQSSRQGYQGERLSLNFQNVDVRSLLQVIADFTNLNIITSDSVGGNLTLRLKDVPWDQALDIILQAKGLDMRKNGNVLLIAPRDELATRDKLDFEQRNQLADLEPLRTEYFQLNYAKVDQFVRLTTDQNQRILSKRGSATFDPRTNLLIVNDTPAKLEDVRRLLQRVDVPQPQVLIEARIVEASDTFSRNLGIRLGGTSGFPTQIGSTSGYGSLSGLGPTVSRGAGGTVTTAPGTSSPGNAVTTPSLVTSSNFVNLPGAGIGGFNPSGIALTLFNASLTRVINLELTALEQDGRGKIISSPRVVTADKVKASIEQGTEIPYQQATSSGATSVSFKKATLRLEVTPQITPEGGVFLNVQVNKDSRGAETLSGPAIDTKNVQTQVLVENGGTIVLGGIYEQQERTTVTKVPFLGDIPYLGYLFKTTARTNDRSELLIFITPRIVAERVTAAAR